MRELRRDPEAGFARLTEMGAIQEVTFEERPQFVATLYPSEQKQQLNRREDQTFLNGKYWTCHPISLK
jgi:hypothetical protein